MSIFNMILYPGLPTTTTYRQQIPERDIENETPFNFHAVPGFSAFSIDLGAEPEPANVRIPVFEMQRAIIMEMRRSTFFTDRELTRLEHTLGHIASDNRERSITINVKIRWSGSVFTYMWVGAEFDVDVTEWTMSSAGYLH